MSNLLQTLIMSRSVCLAKSKDTDNYAANILFKTQTIFIALYKLISSQVANISNIYIYISMLCIHTNAWVMTQIHIQNLNNSFLSEDRVTSSSAWKTRDILPTRRRIYGSQVCTEPIFPFTERTCLWQRRRTNRWRMEPNI